PRAQRARRGGARPLAGGVRDRADRDQPARSGRPGSTARARSARAVPPDPAAPRRRRRRPHAIVVAMVGGRRDPARPDARRERRASTDSAPGAAGPRPGATPRVTKESLILRRIRPQTGTTVD